MRSGCEHRQASLREAIERAQKPFFIKAHAWLNPLQRIPIHEK
jgi:hypothetical protein